MSLEFALVGPILVLLVLGTPTAGLLLWARGAMQLAASQTARCMAIKASYAERTECPNATTYASDIIRDWGVGGIFLPITALEQPDNTCNGTTGNFRSVTITSAAGTGAGLISPFLNIVLTVSACYPSSL